MPISRKRERTCSMTVLVIIFTRFDLRRLSVADAAADGRTDENNRLERRLHCESRSVDWNAQSLDGRLLLGPEDVALIHGVRNIRQVYRYLDGVTAIDKECSNDRLRRQAEDFRD